MRNKGHVTRTGGREATTGHIPGDVALAVGMPSLPPPEGWRWVKLTDFARLETGHTPSREHPEYWGGDIPWIGIRDATENHGREIADTQQHTNQLGIDNSSARVLPAHTVCLSRTASIGYVVVMGRQMATSQDFVNWVCDPKVLDYRFLKYILLAERSSFFRFAHGTTHQTIYFPEVKAFHVCLPSLQTQGRIADMLGVFDEKLELNRRMSRTLEKMAASLFQSWFVDFDPVRAKARACDTGLPSSVAALFPDSIESSPFGPVPKGWKLLALDEIAQYTNGLACQKFPPKAGEAGLPVIKIRELRQGTSDSADRATAEVPEKYIVANGDVLFSWSGSLLVSVWCGGRGVLNQHVFKVSSASYPKWLYYHATLHHLEEFQRIAADKATTMGHIQRRHLSNARIAIPDARVLRAAHDILGSLFARQINVLIQSSRLTGLRDALLPKLLSGELELPEAVDVADEATA